MCNNLIFFEMEFLEGMEFLGIPVINTRAVTELLLMFALNILVTAIIVGGLYYKKSKRRDYVYTFMLISTTVFLLMFALGKTKLEMGLALGMFAIFGIVRYRTDTVPIREMTYLFVIIGVSVLNGLDTRESLVQSLLTNFLFVLMVWIMESMKFMNRTACKLVVYEKIKLITPEHREEMLEDIKARTGLDVLKIEIGHIDFLKDIAFVKVYYKSESTEVNTVDNITKVSQFNG